MFRPAHVDLAPFPGSFVCCWLLFWARSWVRKWNLERLPSLLSQLRILSISAQVLRWTWREERGRDGVASSSLVLCWDRFALLLLCCSLGRRGPGLLVNASVPERSEDLLVFVLRCWGYSGRDVRSVRSACRLFSNASASGSWSIENHAASLMSLAGEDVPMLILP